MPHSFVSVNVLWRWVTVARHLESASNTGALIQRSKGDDVAFVRPTTEHTEHACPGELCQDLPLRPRSASVNIWIGDTEVAV